MLEKLQIRDFQAHAKLSIDLAPGVTAIVGPSDVGKSSVLRALRWAALNTPGGDAYIRHGAPGAAVRLVLDGGQTVVRMRKGVENTYELNGRELRAFGTGVPEPVASLLNVGPANFQGQHDAPYWLSDTAGEVSRQLNAVVDLGCVDVALAAALRRVASSRAAEAAAKVELTVAREEAGRLSWVDEAAAAFDVVEAAAKMYRAAGLAAAELRVCAVAAGGHKRRWDAAAVVADAAAVVVAAAGKAGKAGEVRRSLAAAVATAARYKAVVSQPCPDYGLLAAAASAAQGAAALREGLSRSLASLCSLRAKSAVVADAHVAAATSLATAAKGGCPVCGGPLNLS